jgi:hypothetical protein
MSKVFAVLGTQNALFSRVKAAIRHFGVFLSKKPGVLDDDTSVALSIGF